MIEDAERKNFALVVMLAARVTASTRMAVPETLAATGTLRRMSAEQVEAAGVG